MGQLKCLEMVLKRCQIDRQAVIDLKVNLEELSENLNVLKLDLAENYVGEDGGQVLLQGVGNLSNIKEVYLNLENNKINDYCL